MADTKNISVAYGDGIGPEIMEATLRILKEANARITIEPIEIGEKLYKTGNTSGISENAWESVARTKLLLKAPITTPQGKGYKSLNVTFRKTLGLFANVRPTTAYSPFIESVQPKMDLVIVRENEEDLYAGVEYRVTENFMLSYKIITRHNSEKICRFAFEYARQNGRKKVTCLVKDNIMKIADGLFHDVFKEVAKDYPEIQAESMIVDIGSAKIASNPAHFDVVVTLNLYGDIVSDIAAEVSGSVGLAGSANIGKDAAMFEAVHGSAPDIAGKNIANPSGLLNAAVMMLEYIGQSDVAAKIKNAWLKTIEDGIHTGDVYKEGVSKQKVGTKEFADAVIENLGNKPAKLMPAHAQEPRKINVEVKTLKKWDRKLIGCDVYLNLDKTQINALGDSIKDSHPNFKLHLISQRGLKIWPNAADGESIEEFAQCRFIGFEDTGITQKDVADLQISLINKGLTISSVQNLFTFDGAIGFTLAQGE
jgi:isocitrate dehydrogenase